MKRYIWKHVMLSTLAFVLIGTVPRALHLISVRPGAEWVYIVDLVVCTICLISCIAVVSTSDED